MRPGDRPGSAEAPFVVVTEIRDVLARRHGAQQFLHPVNGVVLVYDDIGEPDIPVMRHPFDNRRSLVLDRRHQ
jgi:hypothetical protein